MANYYTMLCFKVDLPREACEFLVGVDVAMHELLEAGKVTTESVTPAELEVARNILAEDEGTVQCSFEFEDQDLIITSDESAQTEVLAAMLQAALRHFNLDAAVGFEWAATASRDLTDAYGGGAVVVTRDNIQYMSSDYWLARQLEKHKKQGSTTTMEDGEALGIVQAMALRYAEHAACPAATESEVLAMNTVANFLQSHFGEVPHA